MVFIFPVRSIDIDFRHCIRCCGQTTVQIQNSLWLLPNYRFWFYVWLVLSCFLRTSSSLWHYPLHPSSNSTRIYASFNPTKWIEICIPIQYNAVSILLPSFRDQTEFVIMFSVFWFFGFLCLFSAHTATDYTHWGLHQIHYATTELPYTISGVWDAKSKSTKMCVLYICVCEVLYCVVCTSEGAFVNKLVAQRSVSSITVQYGRYMEWIFLFCFFFLRISYVVCLLSRVRLSVERTKSNVLCSISVCSRQIHNQFSIVWLYVLDAETDRIVFQRI